MFKMVLVVVAVASGLLAALPAASPSRAGEPPGAQFTISIDCNRSLVGIQSFCNVSNMMATRSVDVVYRNNGPTPFQLGAFGLRVLNPDTARLFAPEIGGVPIYMNGNPDAAPVVSSNGWACGAPSPVADDPGTVEAGQDSVIACFNGSMAGATMSVGASLALASIHYNIPAGADPGPVALTFAASGNPSGGSNDTSVFDGTFNEGGSCAPVQTIAAICNGATINLYCPIDMADVNNDGRVNVADMGITAVANGTLPAPQHLDQNFDGIINVADRGIIASNYGKFVVQCP